MNVVTPMRILAVFVLSIMMGGSLAAVGLAADAPLSSKAFFAGGCFWCMEEVFEKVPGVTSVTSGYMGGRGENPSYEQVSAGGTGHAEAVEVVYDPAKVSYAALLDAFWHNDLEGNPIRKGYDHCLLGRGVRREKDGKT